MNLLNLTGASFLENTSTFERIEMKNGLATIKAVTTHISKKGHSCAKIEFQDFSDKENKLAGHVEYLSTGEGNRFYKLAQKLAYIAKYSKNEAARQAFAQVIYPIQVVKDAAGQELNFKTMDELKQIQDSYGDNVTFIWNEDVDRTRKAIIIANPEAFIQQYVAVMSQFVGETLFLELKKDGESGFQRLISINPPKL